MLRVSVPARREARKGLFSNAAMALALACGGVIASAGIAAPASAQEFSNEWRNAAADVSDAIIKSDQDPAVKALVAQVSSADAAQKPALVAQLDAALGGVIAKLPTLIPLATTADDKFTTGQYHFNIGSKIGDARIQRDGIKMMVDSGKAPPDQVALLTYYVGSFSWDFKEYGLAREYLQKAYDLGHKTDNVEQLIVATYFSQNQFAEGLAAADRMIAERGGGIPLRFYLRNLEVVRDQRLGGEIPIRAGQLARYYPTQDNWRIALQVLLESVDLTADESLDAYRLMRLTNAMKEARTYRSYIETVDVNRMSNEILPVIEEGIRLNLLNAEDSFVKEALEVANARAPEDRAAADEDATLARAASDAVSARSTADNFLTLENFAGAEEFYKLALQRAPEDADRLNMRIGVAQARQGKIAEARTSFQAVKGARTAVAAMWLAWLDTQAGS
jgi:tetratricopeptide (TPR) repeat protein